MTKAKRGGLKDTTLDGLLFKLLEQVRKRSNFDPRLVGDICLGNVSGPNHHYDNDTNECQVRDARAVYYIRAAALGAGCKFNYPNGNCEIIC